MTAGLGAQIIKAIVALAGGIIIAQKHARNAEVKGAKEID